MKQELQHWLTSEGLVGHVSKVFDDLGIETMEDLEILVSDGDLTKAGLREAGVKAAPAAKLFRAFDSWRATNAKPQPQ